MHIWLLSNILIFKWKNIENLGLVNFSEKSSKTKLS